MREHGLSVHSEKKGSEAVRVAFMYVCFSPPPPQVHNVFKRRLDPTGHPIESTGVKHEMGEALKSDVLDKHGNGSSCGSCYGAEEVRRLKA